MIINFVLLRQGYPENLEGQSVLEFSWVYAGSSKDPLFGQVQVLAEEVQHVQAALSAL